ncbi:MAG: metallophosphoesterase [Chloroflexi bacterium]|nr:metallophosphoesterase [Chloroflexota bacterium]
MTVPPDELWLEPPPTLSNGRHWVARLALALRQREPVVEQVKIPVRGLPPALRGLRIAHLSDFHTGNLTRGSHIERVADITQRLQPDLIALTGDYVNRNPHDARFVAAALSRLRAPLGVQLVFGNHDHWINIAVVLRHFAAAGLHPLCNEACRLVYRGQEFWVVGTDSARRKRADLPRAMHGVPADAFKILLAHEPDMAEYAAGYNIALQLSGHTHGGQIRLPWLGAPRLPRMGRRYSIGLSRTPHGWIYVTRGIGVSNPPIRFNCPPEISLLTLEAATVTEQGD